MGLAAPGEEGSRPCCPDAEAGGKALAPRQGGIYRTCLSSPQNCFAEQMQKGLISGSASRVPCVSSSHIFAAWLLGFSKSRGLHACSGPVPATAPSLPLHGDSLAYPWGPSPPGPRVCGCRGSSGPPWGVRGCCVPQLGCPGSYGVRGGTGPSLPEKNYGSWTHDVLGPQAPLPLGPGAASSFPTSASGHRGRGGRALAGTARSHFLALSQAQASLQSGGISRTKTPFFPFLFFFSEKLAEGSLGWLIGRDTYGRLNAVRRMSLTCGHLWRAQEAPCWSQHPALVPVSLGLPLGLQVEAPLCWGPRWVPPWGPPDPSAQPPCEAGPLPLLEDADV